MEALKARLVVLVAAGLAAATVSRGAKAADVAPPEAVRAFNEDIQRVWKKLIDEGRARVKAEAAAALARAAIKKGHYEVAVRKLKKLELGMDVAPGFERIGTDRIDVAIPLRGTWSLVVEAEVRVEAHAGPLKARTDLDVTVRVDDLSVGALLLLDDADPLRPQIKRVRGPEVTFHVKVASKTPVLREVLDVLSPIGDLVAHHMVKKALDDLTPGLAKLKGFPGPVPFANAQPLVDSGEATPFAEIVANVDRKIRRDQMPHGTLVEARMDEDSRRTWSQAYGPGGPGNAGKVATYEGTGDSAIWSGHYLASQAFRFHATNDPDALDNVKHALAGIGTLLDVNGGTGLLARAAAPEDSALGRVILGKQDPRRAVLNGVPWVGRQSGDGVSRDQYSGVFFGLALAHDLVGDDGVRREAARRIGQMVDYLVQHDWWIDEDRKPFARPGGVFPTIWAGGVLQRLNILSIGNRAAPGRYDAELRRLGPLAKVEWLDSWTGTFSMLDSYFPYNLSQINWCNYLRLETDQERFEDMARAYRIERSYVGRHQNPHFDMIHLASFDPASRDAILPSVRQALRRFVERPHRNVSPEVVDLSGVAFEKIRMRSFDVLGGGAGEKVVRMPTSPLDMTLRESAHTFLWQQDPFTPAVPGEGNPREECLGVDLVLPYWMGRDHGL